MSKRAIAPQATANANPGSTRDQVLGTARRLIQTRSYLGLSFQDVADAVGVRKPSLYHHFPSKEALGAEVLLDAMEAFRRWTRPLAERPPADQLNAYFKMYRNDIRAGEQVCPGGSFVAGWDCIEDGLRRAVREIRSEQVLWLTGVLGALLPSRKGAGALASYVYATCQGALITARMTGRVKDFDDVIAEVKSSLLA
jgi:TetR/AcrR family transcriptional regulator, transcriptional repressor for nem operon